MLMTTIDKKTINQLSTNCLKIGEVAGLADVGVLLPIVLFIHSDIKNILCCFPS